MRAYGEVDIGEPLVVLDAMVAADWVDAPLLDKVRAPTCTELLPPKRSDALSLRVS